MNRAVFIRATLILPALLACMAMKGQFAGTMPANNVTATSATLYGFVGNLSAPANIWFQYVKTGDTQIYTVAGIPSTINDSQFYNDSAQIAGLTPYALYAFRILAIMGVDTVYGNYSGFFTGVDPVVTVNAASNVTTSSATLNGNVSDAPVGSTISFSYWFGSNYPTPLPASPAVVPDTLSHPVTAQLHSLLPYTYYNYSINVFDSFANWQSGTMQFYTGTGGPYHVTTLAASNVSSTAATLNGMVENLPFASVLYFDYWVANGSHTTVPASPANVNDTGFYIASANISGLTPNTSYFFRLEAVDSITSRFGDSLVVYTGSSGIPNFDFENWTTTTGQNLPYWYNIFGPAIQVTPGYTGNYAVKLQHNATGLGALIEGYPDMTSNNGNNLPQFYGGVPYAARPDTLTGMFEYDIVSGDTAFVLVIFKSHGQVIAESLTPFTGSSPNNYEALKFPINYTSSATPDTMILGIIPTNVNGNGNIIGSWVIADDLAFQGSYPPIPNGDFENWQSFSFSKLNNWSYEDMSDFGIYSNPDSECVNQTAAAEHGNYAAVLQNLPFLGVYIPGNISTAPGQNNGNTPSFPVDHAVETLNGYYQFYPLNGDTFVVYCVLYYQGNQVGGGGFTTTEPATSYTQFTATIAYNNNAGIPDSATIFIQPFSSTPQGASRALIDNLSFDGFASGVQSVPAADRKGPDITIYPNPGTGNFTVTYPVQLGQITEFNVTDLPGRTVYRGNDEGKGTGFMHMEFNYLPSGVYLLHLNSATMHLSGKFVVQR